MKTSCQFAFIMCLCERLRNKWHKIHSTFFQTKNIQLWQFKYQKANKSDTYIHTPTPIHYIHHRHVLKLWAPKSIHIKLIFVMAKYCIGLKMCFIDTILLININLSKRLTTYSTRVYVYDKCTTGKTSCKESHPYDVCNFYFWSSLFFSFSSFFS